MPFNPIQKIILIPFLLLLNSCITPFIPHTNEDNKLLVVEGLITDQPDTNTIKLSRSLPPGIRSYAKPVTGCTVTVSDDLGNTFIFKETVDGTYVSDPSEFQGVIGRFYTLHINTNDAYYNLNYASYPMELKPVPVIDSVYYEKVTIAEAVGGYSKFSKKEGCQIYLNSNDPNNKCKFYKWDFTETWEFQLPYPVTNWRCWVSSNSSLINIKTTSGLAEDRIVRHPLNFISNKTDRLKEKYSILVNQYSLNEDEYAYWEKLHKVTESIGTLYDITPAAIPGNIYCIENPTETVLGYFSVSAKTSKRIFIKDRFLGLVNLYTYDACFGDTIWGDTYIPNLNTTVWALIDRYPIYVVITRDRGCADCTERGTNREPDFWKEGK
jgi:hypothetical protein